MSVVDREKETDDVYIGRGRCPRGGEPGRWGNPFRIGRDGSRAEVIARYAKCFATRSTPSGSAR